MARDPEGEGVWLGYKRDDAVRALMERGWTRENARGILENLPDEVFQIIRAQAVEELAECYIVGMRATIRVREAMDYRKGMWPADTPQSIAARESRAEGWRAYSRRTASSRAGGDS